MVERPRLISPQTGRKVSQIGTFYTDPGEPILATGLPGTSKQDSAVHCTYFPHVFLGVIYFCVAGIP
jgi:hypothetical protein